MSHAATLACDELSPRTDTGETHNVGPVSTDRSKNNSLDKSIDRALSRDSRTFLKANRQTGGE